MKSQLEKTRSKEFGGKSLKGGHIQPQMRFGGEWRPAWCCLVSICLTGFNQKYAEPSTIYGFLILIDLNFKCKSV